MLKQKLAYLKFLFSREKTLYKKLQNTLGFFPFNLSYYKRAFIHRSASIKNVDGQYVNNERLEYLGDAILDAIVADYLFKKFPRGNEGSLTKLRSKIVNGEYLNKLAIRLRIGKFVKSKTKNNRGRKNLYGNALEALIGAIYLDMGYKFAKKFIVTKIIEQFVNLDELLFKETNYKSKLIEWAQKDKKEIDFNTFQQTNSSNDAPVFTSIIRIDNQIFGNGTGHSKKEAEQQAAKDTLLSFGLD